LSLPEPLYSSLRSTPRPDGAWFDEAAAHAAVGFFPTYCRLTKAEWAGRPMHLAPWQAAEIIRPAFGWKRADGTRLFRRVFVWVPRKNGKTELMAGVSHLCLLGDAEHAGRGYAIAYNEDQAKQVFEAAHLMRTYSPKLGRLYEPIISSLYAPRLKARFETLTGKAEGKHGLNASFLIGDEVHEWKSDRLYTYVRNSMAARRQPMEWLISTAGLGGGIGQELYDDCVKICEGVLPDPETLVVIYAASPEDDIHDPATWRKANPNYGVVLKPDYFQRMSREARAKISTENDFRRFHLNQWVAQEKRWIPLETWNACGPADRSSKAWKEIAERLRGRKCYGGLDLASTRDMNALVWLFPPTASDPVWRIVVRYWWPRAQAEEQMRAARVRFDHWIAEGAIVITDGDASDHHAIERQVVEDCDLFDVQGLAVDRFNAHSVITNLIDAGVPAVPFNFRMLFVAPAVKIVERMVYRQELAHGGHPVLRWNVDNVALGKPDDQGNAMPSKRTSKGKIDGVAALLMSVALAHGEKVEGSYLESGSLLVL